MPARIQAIPDNVFPGWCATCSRERTCCAVVTIRNRFGKTVMCSCCRLAWEGRWVPETAMAPEVVLPDDEPYVRRLGKGLRARSPSKHGLPFTF